MQGLVALFAIIAPWLILGLLAGGQGADSRQTLPDDHQR